MRSKACKCGGRVLDGKCNKCGPVQAEHRANAHQRGYDRQWRKTSKSERRGALCVCCEAQGQTRFAELMDHIQPHKGDRKLFVDRANRQPLCWSCHSTHKARIEREYSGQHVVAAWERLLERMREARGAGQLVPV